jgi:carbamoyltransferase
MAFKESLIPGLDRRERRICQGLDAAAALVSEDGVLAASAQERHNGEKGTCAFPAYAIESCLDMAGASLADVDVVTHGFRYQPSIAWDLDAFTRRWFDEIYCERAQLEVLRSHYPQVDWERKLVRVPHHLAHAASAYYLSGFDEATVLVADGMGEAESTSVFRGAGSQLRAVRSYPISSSLGILYGALTLYLGFTPAMDEYKVMGLAPYGDPDRFGPAIDQLRQLGQAGALAVPMLGYDRSPVERETHRGMIRQLETIFGPKRHPDAPLEQRHMDVAATLQCALQECLLHILQAAQQQPQLPSRNFCMAGGVALNCTANGLILRSGMFDDAFVQPAAGDDGTALGAALWHLHQYTGARLGRMTMPFWGEPATGQEIGDALRELGPDHEVRRLREDDLIARVCDLIISGSVVAWFQGRMEFGPRALGSRSILADPSQPGMRAHLNAVVKQREEFRPFAPAVIAEEAAEYFEIGPGQEHIYQHMLFVTQVREKYRDRLPAITHVDGSARVQVVVRDSAPQFWKLLRQLGNDSGIPVVLNTSFNLRGQPIVRTAREAVATYARSRMDALAIGEWLATRRQRQAAEETAHG